MRFPSLRGVIDRRILVNYRVAPEVMARHLPPPFRPKLHRGHALAGICLIRLRHVRPRGLPAWLGLASENAAHRVAVEWDEDGEAREGVFVRRRDTGSRWNVLAGGRVFPGRHWHATFRVLETADHFEVAGRSADGALGFSVVAERARSWPATSIFASLDEASAFFAAGALGYSATSDPHRFHGLELRCDRWAMEPLQVHSLQSSVFDDRAAFPAGSIEFDDALLMRGIGHTWHGQPDLCAPNGGG